MALRRNAPSGADPSPPARGLAGSIGAQVRRGGWASGLSVGAKVTRPPPVLPTVSLEDQPARRPASAPRSVGLARAGLPEDPSHEPLDAVSESDRQAAKGPPRAVRAVGEEPSSRGRHFTSGFDSRTRASTASAYRAEHRSPFSSRSLAVTCHCWAVT